MKLITRRFHPPEGPGLQPRIEPARAEQLAAVAELTLQLLAHPWNYQTHAADYEESRVGARSWQQIQATVERCARCGMAAPALSVWLDIAPDAVTIPGPLREAARER